MDGKLTEGAGDLDESMLTGKPDLVAKKFGDDASAGTLLAQIIRLVEAAKEIEAPIQRLVDRVSAWFVPAVAGICALTFVLWLVLGPAPAFVPALVNAVAVLIFTCPCALGLATPISLITGSVRGAQAGILVKDAVALERLTAAAFAHGVAFTPDLQSVVHVHPMGKEPKSKGDIGGPDLRFHLEPTGAGFFKFYVQVCARGQDEFASFGLIAAPAKSDALDSAHAHHEMNMTYAGPMHPEITSSKSGQECPKCGMTLVLKKN